MTNNRDDALFEIMVSLVQGLCIDLTMDTDGYL